MGNIESILNIPVMVKCCVTPKNMKCIYCYHNTLHQYDVNSTCYGQCASFTSPCICNELKQKKTIIGMAAGMG